MKVTLLSSLFLFLLSCSNSHKEKVCKVGNEVLTETELAQRVEVLYSHLSEKEARKAAIEDWATQQQVKLTIKNKDAESKLKNELLVQKDLYELNLFSLENNYISKHINKTVSEEDIIAYYTKHNHGKKNNTFIVKALRITIPDSMQQQLNIYNHYLLKNDKDRATIKKIGNLYATNYFFEEERWIYIEDLLRGLPINKNSIEELVTNKKHTIIHHNNETTFLTILNYKTKILSSPTQTERQQARDEIMRQRINKLRKKAKETVSKNVKEKYPIIYY